MTAFAFIRVSLMLLASTLVAFQAGAQDRDTAAPQPSRASTVEITPFVAIGSVRSSSVGAGVSFPVTSSLSIESEVGYRRGEGRMNALSSNVSLLYALPRIGRSTPYLAAGAGLEQYGAPLVRPEGSGIATDPKITFAVNAGGGLYVPVDDKWRMRTDARWFRALGRDGSSEHWRVAHGVSFGAGKR